jgi:dienelactone hydrolase
MPIFSVNFLRTLATSLFAIGWAILLLVSTDTPAQTGAAVIPEPQFAKVPMKGAGLFGATLELTTEIFKPAGAGPFPVLVYAHGRSGTQQERSALSEVVPREFLNFWLTKGFAVVAPARPGYGKTGGSDREVPGHRWDGNRCIGTLDPERVAEVAGAAILATVGWVREQPWANASKLILSGNSVGGLTSVSLGAINPTGVLGYINFAGGVGGNPALSPGKSCAPERVRDAYATYGKSTRLPSLWLYAENDLFWGPDMPRVWHTAFAAGGSPSKLITTPPLPGQDGHELIFLGRSLWVEPVDAFLKQLGFD